MKTRVALCAAMVPLSPVLALACPVCFGASDSGMVQGSDMGILALLVVTVAVLGAFATFFRTLARRESRVSAALADHAADAEGMKAGRKAVR